MPKIYDPVTKTFKEVTASPKAGSIIKPIGINPTHVKGTGLNVKRAMNSENEGNYSDDDLQGAKSQGEKKGSQTSRNEPSSRLEKGQQESKFTISTDNSSSKLKQN